VGDISIPYVFAALMAIEYVFNALRRNGHQTPRDSAVSLLVTFPHFTLLAIVPVVWFAAYRGLAPVVPWQLPAHAWWIWPVGIVVMDFAAYWMHRYHHALNVTWAVHSVHHSSDQFTMTTGGRSSFAEPFVNVASGAYLILIAPVLLGLPVAAAGVGWLVKDCWGFAVHTRNIDKLGPLEYVLATPSHHRVHHATNAIYVGRNYAFVFIVWDKLFGTFQPELRTVPPVFGTADSPASFRPLTVAFHGLRAVWRDAVATTRWRDKLRIWLMPAGWRPADVRGRSIGDARAEPPEPAGLYVVGGLQLAYIAVLLGHLSLTSPAYTASENLAYLGFLILGTVVSGEYFERSRHYPATEYLRAAAAAAMLALTQRWFGRPLDATVALVIGIGCANLMAPSVAWRWSSRRDLARRVYRVSKRSPSRPLR
jgi:alkylglycerol monooxygenase